MKKIHLPIGISLSVLFFAIVFISCKKQTSQTAAEDQGTPQLPAQSYDYAGKHGVNNGVATLGRVLFYDRSLSGNKAVSCGSCHKQQNAFADNVRFNKGGNGLDLKRNSPSIQGIKGFEAGLSSLGTVPSDGNQQKALLFWDGRQTSVSDMVLNPVLNHNEMNMPDFATLEDRLSKIGYYPALFKDAFGDEQVTRQRIAYALEGFIACLNTTANDLTIVTLSDGTTTMMPAGQNFSGNLDSPGPFATLEDEGRFLFHSKYNCAQCHDPSNTGSYGSVVSPVEMFNIGLDEVYADNGLGAITGKPGDKGIFKVPTLKNISLTAPYMHDGRFNTLSDVLDHYSHGIQPNANLSPKFVNSDGTPKKLDILPAEKQALIAFLNSLVDEDFITSPMYANPFKK